MEEGEGGLVGSGLDRVWVDDGEEMGSGGGGCSLELGGREEWAGGCSGWRSLAGEAAGVEWGTGKPG